MISISNNDEAQVEVYLGATYTSHDNGTGVYWGENDSRNASEKCIDTQCRAETRASHGMALIHALRIFLESIGAATDCLAAGSIRKFVVVTNSICTISIFAQEKYFKYLIFKGIEDPPAFYNSDYSFDLYNDINDMRISAGRVISLVQYIRAMLSNVFARGREVVFLLASYDDLSGIVKASELANNCLSSSPCFHTSKDWKDMAVDIHEEACRLLGKNPKKPKRRKPSDPPEPILWPTRIELEDLGPEMQARIMRRTQSPRSPIPPPLPKQAPARARKKRPLDDTDIDTEIARPAKRSRLLDDAAMGTTITVPQPKPTEEIPKRSPSRAEETKPAKLGHGWGKYVDAHLSRRRHRPSPLRPKYARLKYTSALGVVQYRTVMVAGSNSTPRNKRNSCNTDVKSEPLDDAGSSFFFSPEPPDTGLPSPPPSLFDSSQPERLSQITTSEPLTPSSSSQDLHAPCSPNPRFTSPSPSPSVENQAEETLSASDTVLQTFTSTNVSANIADFGPLPLLGSIPADPDECVDASGTAQSTPTPVRPSLVQGWTEEECAAALQEEWDLDESEPRPNAKSSLPIRSKDHEALRSSAVEGVSPAPAKESLDVCAEAPTKSSPEEEDGSTTPVLSQEPEWFRTEPVTTSMPEEDEFAYTPSPTNFYSLFRDDDDDDNTAGDSIRVVEPMSVPSSEELSHPDPAPLTEVLVNIRDDSQYPSGESQDTANDLVPVASAKDQTTTPLDITALSSCHTIPSSSRLISGLSMSEEDLLVCAAALQDDWDPDDP